MTIGLTLREFLARREMWLLRETAESRTALRRLEHELGEIRACKRAIGMDAPKQTMSPERRRKAAETRLRKRRNTA